LIGRVAGLRDTAGDGLDEAGVTAYALWCAVAGLGDPVEGAVFLLARVIGG